MVTIKSYTDLNQSRRLAEVLPHKSADMFIADVFLKEEQTHSYKFHFLTTWGYKNFDELKERENKFVQFIPCWSLAALLDYLLVNQGVIVKSLDRQWEVDCIIHVEYSKELVDVCYEVILKLNEEKLL